MCEATVEVILVDPVLKIANPEGFDLLQCTGLVIGSGGGCGREGGCGCGDSGGGKDSWRWGGPHLVVGSLHRSRGMRGYWRLQGIRAFSGREKESRDRIVPSSNTGSSWYESVLVCRN